MKRVMIVIVAGLAFGVTAAYATTTHSGSAPARTPRTAAPRIFAVPGDSTTEGAPTTASDDLVTHDHADDQGQDEQGQDEQGQDEQEPTEAPSSQDDNSQGDDSQGDQQGGSQSGESDSGGD